MTRTVMIAVVCAMTILTMTAPITASTDTSTQPADLPDDCENAEVFEPGKYNGTLTPNDRDVFAVDISKGEYITLNISYSGAAETLSMSTDTVEDAFSPGTFTGPNGGEPRDTYGNKVYPHNDGLELNLGSPESTFNLRVYAEGEGPVCIRFRTADETAGKWKLSFAESQQTAPSINCSN